MNLKELELTFPPMGEKEQQCLKGGYGNLYDNDTKIMWGYSSNPGNTNWASSNVTVYSGYGASGYYDSSQYYWGTGSNGDQSYGNGGGGGGADYSATHNTINPTDFFHKYFSNFSLNVNFSTSTPSGYTLDNNGNFVNSRTGEVVQGVTMFVPMNNSNTNGITSIYISPAAQMNEQRMYIIMGHELIHAHQYAEHTDLYRTNFEQFQFNSEYAAYQWELQQAKAFGDQATVELSQKEIESNSRGSYSGWTSTYNDIPIVNKLN